MDKALVITVIIILLTSAFFSFQPAESNHNGKEIRYDSINLDTTISIMGDNGFATSKYVSSGNGSRENPYVISDLTINLSGLSSGNGIDIQSTNVYFVISNVTIELNSSLNSGPSTGIYIYNVSNGTIKSVRVFAPSYPPTYFVNDTQVYEPDVNLIGINVFDSKYLNLENISIENMAQGGIDVDYSSHISVTDSIVNYTVIDGLFSYNSKDIVFQGNKLFYDHHNNIQAINSSEVYIENNFGYQSNGTNIWLWNSSNSTVFNNTVTGCTHQSILVTGFLQPAINDTVSDNRLFNSSQGIVLTWTDNSSVVDNQVYRTNQGIVFGDINQSVVNTTIRDNSLYDNNLSLLLYFGSNNITVSDNNIFNSDTGIYDWGAPFNRITSNYIYNNNLGLDIENSIGLQTYNNYFNNSNNAVSNSPDLWNVSAQSGMNIVGGNELGGNYWSNYYGSENKGIGQTDLPYNNNGQIRQGGDYAPLVPTSSQAFTLGNFSGSYNSYVSIPVFLKNGYTFYNITQNFAFNPDLLRFIGVRRDVSSQYVNFTASVIIPGLVEVNGTGVFYSFSGNTTLYTIVLQPLVLEQFTTNVSLASTVAENQTIIDSAVSSVYVSSGWTTIGPMNLTFQVGGSPVENGSGEVTCFGFSPYFPSILYAGSGIKGQYGFGGIYRSNNSGRTWVSINNGLSFLSVEGIEVSPYNPNEVVIITQGLNWWHSGAIYKTIDGGLSWQETYQQGGLNLEYENGTLYAATFDHLLVSSNFGTTWTSIAETGMNFPTGILESVFVENGGKTIYAGVSGGNTYTGSGTDYILFSNDSGKNFTVLSTVPGYYQVYYQQIVQDPANPSHLWLLCFSGYGYDSLYQSFDSGLEWNLVNLTSIGIGSQFKPGIGYAPQYIAYNEFYKNVIYLAGDEYFYVSVNDGKNFTRMIPGPNFDVRFIYSDPYQENTTYVGADQGLFISTDNCSSWRSLDNRSTNLISDMAISGGNIITNVADYSSIDSNDSGKSWFMSKDLSGEDGVSATDPYNSSIVIFIALEFEVSHDGGSTFFVPSGNWSGTGGIQKPPLSRYVAFSHGGTESTIVFDEKYQGEIFIAGKSAIFRSNDSGLSFNPIPNSPSSGLAMTVSVNNTLYISNSSGLYASYDNGATWILINHQFTGYDGLVSLSADPFNSSILAGTTDLLYTSAYLSEDGGRYFFFANISSPYILPAPGSICFVNVSSSAPLIFMSGSGIYVSYNLGQSWENKSFDLNSEASVTSLSYVNHTVYISTWGDGVMYDDQLFNESFYKTDPILIFYLPSNSSISVNNETFHGKGYNEIYLTPGKEYVQGIINGSTITYSIRMNYSSTYFLNFSPIYVPMKVVATGLLQDEPWEITLNGLPYNLKGSPAQIELKPGVYRIQFYPGYTDFSISYPQFSNMTIVVSFGPVTVFNNFTQVISERARNITSEFKNMFWDTEVAYNQGYFTFSGGGDSYLMNASTLVTNDIGSLFPSGQTFSVSPYQDGFIFGGSLNDTEPGVIYYNMTQKTQEIFKLPRQWNGVGAKITDVFPINGTTEGLIGGTVNETFFGTIYEGNIVQLSYFLPAYFSYSVGQSNPYSASYDYVLNAVIISDGIYLGEFYLSNDTFRDLTDLLPSGFSLEFTSSFSPSNARIASSRNETVMIGSNDYQQAGVMVLTSSGIADITDLFPGIYPDSVQYYGGNFIISGQCFGPQVIYVYNASTSSVTKIDIPDIPNGSIVDSATLEGNNLYYTTFNSRTVGEYSVLSSYFGLVNLRPTGAITILANTESTFKMGNLTYIGKDVTIHGFSGTYNVTVSAPGYENRTETVSIPDHSTTYLTVTLEKVYDVSLISQGIPNGTEWSVKIGNETLHSVNSSIRLQLVNGSYDYSAFTSNQSSVIIKGSFTVDGSNQTVSVNFAVKLYAVAFVETGLPPETPWSITLNGRTINSTSSGITFNESNGSYSYKINAISGYGVRFYSGNITVNGSSLDIQTNWFVVAYSLSFIEHGIPNGTTWSISLRGTTFSGQSVNETLSSSADSITFNEPNGSYSYAVRLPSGYAGTNLKGSIAIGGASVSAIISTHSSASYLLIIILVIVVVVAIFGAILVMRGRGRRS
ncbi:MAG: right-handed parallel beta-helix repeat-containing protein [Candidatus Thermoplasmatota archaeon]|jgi:photosystem II stability/assembly factor-like uncharacterized protein|nr:right-handed parallel beta-helix repeat-containing protein [Candidatus Thermoplasmatota archaeon]